MNYDTSILRVNRDIFLSIIISTLKTTHSLYETKLFIHSSGHFYLNILNMYPLHYVFVTKLVIERDFCEK